MKITMRKSWLFFILIFILIAVPLNILTARGFRSNPFVVKPLIRETFFQVILREQKILGYGDRGIIGFPWTALIVDTGSTDAASGKVLDEPEKPNRVDSWAARLDVAGLLADILFTFALSFALVKVLCHRRCHK